MRTPGDVDVNLLPNCSRGLHRRIWTDVARAGEAENLNDAYLFSSPVFLDAGMTGSGYEKLIRAVDVLHLSLDLPIVVDVVDTRERIREILPEVEAMVEHGLVTVRDVQMTRKVPGK